MWKPKFLSKITEAEYEEYDDIFEDDHNDNSVDEVVESNDPTMGKHISLKDEDGELHIDNDAESDSHISNEL
jgi:hypothetical protein